MHTEAALQIPRAMIQRRNCSGPRVQFGLSIVLIIDVNDRYKYEVKSYYMYKSCIVLLACDPVIAACPTTSRLVKKQGQLVSPLEGLSGAPKAT